VFIYASYKKIDEQEAQVETTGNFFIKDLDYFWMLILPAHGKLVNSLSSTCICICTVYKKIGCRSLKKTQFKNLKKNFIKFFQKNIKWTYIN
jgi:hypothetical protein